MSIFKRLWQTFFPKHPEESTSPSDQCYAVAGDLVVAISDLEERMLSFIPYAKEIPEWQLFDQLGVQEKKGRVLIERLSAAQLIEVYFFNRCGIVKNRVNYHFTRESILSLHYAGYIKNARGHCYLTKQNVMDAVGVLMDGEAMSYADIAWEIDRHPTTVSRYIEYLKMYQFVTLDTSNIPYQISVQEGCDYYEFPVEEHSFSLVSI